MAEYKLYYFDTRGLAETSRLIFAYAGQPYEDIRYTKDNWPSVKQNFFYGKVPVLEVIQKGGEVKQLSQSSAIARYLGEQFGLAGKDSWEKAKVNESSDVLKDVATELGPFVYTKMGFREGNADELQKTIFEPGIKKFMPVFAKLIEKSGSGYIVASGITFVDFGAADYFYTLKKLVPEIFKEYPSIEHYITRVYSANESIKKYVATRKE